MTFASDVIDTTSVALRRRVVPIVRAGALAREMCRRGGRGEVAAVFARSLYVRIGDEFLCIGEPAIGNGPLTLIASARVSGLGLCRGKGASISQRGIALGDLLFGLDQCEAWPPPRWAEIPSSIPSAAICAIIARRAATQSPPDSLAHALFGANETPLARIARPRVAQFETAMTNDGLSANAVAGLIGLGPGLTPSGDDFLMGALALLGALKKTETHAALAQPVADAAPALTSPLSACFLRAAAAGHVGESLYDAVASVLSGNVDAAVAAAHRIGHTSGWDMLAGVATTLRIVGS
jgi:hypothetical protein